MLYNYFMGGKLVENTVQIQNDTALAKTADSISGQVNQNS